METTVKLTQGEEIIEYLMEHGTITRLEAASALHIFELLSRIGELKKKGYRFSTAKASYKNRNGRVSHFTVYKLEA